MNPKGDCVDAKRLRENSVLGSSGTTLVELMVAVALFGVLSLAMMTLFGDHSLQIARARNEARLSEQLGEFSEALDLYLSGVTQVISCGCTNSNPCIYSAGATELEDCTVASVDCNVAPDPLLRFEFEDAANPSDAVPAAGCLNSGSSPVAVAIAPDRMILRGCKKRMRLTYTPPVLEVGPTPSQPGTLTIDREDPTVASPTQGAGLTTLHTLRGVYMVRCGHLSPTGSDTGVASKDHFRLHIRMKERIRNDIAASDLNMYESWAQGGLGFFRGTHRETSLDFSFQNLSVHGVHFGKPFSFRDCVLGSSSSADGSYCCSGYRLVNGNCLPMDNCVAGGPPPLRVGVAPSDPSDPNALAECCSHTMNGAAGTCR